jgi:phosphoribosylformimino-5-aminoimidazole carboxamide ribotide isomerase
MIVIPAIDIMDGAVVRLVQGNESRRSDYADTPLGAAARWVEECAEMIHVIDLDAALGRGDNKRILVEIAKKSQAPIQIGGGIRSIEEASELLDSGVYRVLIGSLAFQHPEDVQTLVKRYGGDRVAVSIDHRRGEVRVAGWTKGTGTGITEALSDMKRLGVECILITDIERDGSLNGPDTKQIEAASRDFRVIAAGGVASIGDLRRLRDAGAYAAVVGKALYEGRFTLREALEEMCEC